MPHAATVRAWLVMPFVFAGLPSLEASCPAGRGHPHPSSTACAVCAPGTWSSEGSSECMRCRPGTWSSTLGASEESACRKCPRGTWSAQEGSPTDGSCQRCPAGRWGAVAGLGSETQCTACPAGKWASERGATDAGVCSACPPGKWSDVQGSSSAANCISCPEGTWSDKMGAPSQASCAKCRAGTYNSERGASAESACKPCKAGMYQPAVGQANQSVCMRCEPGKYGTVPGASSCTVCPAGSWNDEYEASSCKVCPLGKWTLSPGSVREEACKPCRGSEDCRGVPDVHVTISMNNLKFSELGKEERSNIRSAYARDIAEACGVDSRAVVDLHGENGTVTLTKDGKITAFVLSATKYSAASLAARLYSSSFRGRIVHSTMAILGTDSSAVVGAVSAGTVSARPEAFAPLHSATTVTTTGASTVVSTTSSAANISGSTGAGSAATTVAPEGKAAERAQQDENPIPFWLWIVVAAAVIGVMVLVCMVVAQRRLQSEDDGKQPEQAPAAQGDLPVLLRGGPPQAADQKELEPSGCSASDCGTDRDMPVSRVLPNFLRTTIDNVEEGGAWHDGELPPEQPPKETLTDCTRACSVGCW